MDAEDHSMLPLFCQNEGLSSKSLVTPFPDGLGQKSILKKLVTLLKLEEHVSTHFEGYFGIESHV